MLPVGECNNNLESSKIIISFWWSDSNERFWKPEHTDAFNLLKRKLTSAPILVFPDFSKPFVLSVDASDAAIGYVLGQINSQGLENVIAYGGRALRDQEKRWHINHKERLALIEAIKTFKAYLTSAEFTVFTDNITVRWLDTNKDALGRLGRWALFLQQYKFKIQHRPGTKNQNADCVSRREYPPSDQPCSPSDDDLPAIGSIEASTKEFIATTFEYPEDNQPRKPEILALNTADQHDDHISDNPTLQHLQENCPDFQAIIDYKRTENLPQNVKHNTEHFDFVGL